MLLQQTVSRSAERRPDAAAVIHGGNRLAYAELEQLSNRLARLLQAAGCEPGDRVALLLPKSIPAIVAMLGVLKARAIYVPLDVTSPAARLARIIDVCEPRCILSTGAARNVLDSLIERRPVPVGWLDTVEPAVRRFEMPFSWRDLAAMSAAGVDSSGTPDDPAHILFTSGSTGVPKGVVITHANVAHFLTWATRYFGTSPSDRISCHPPLHFDLSTFDIYGTFLAGAELHLVTSETSLLPHKLAEYIRRTELTQWFSVPSVFRYMAQFDVLKHGDFPTLKRVLWCGEALPTPTLIYWMTRLPHAAFTNLYGPTETTIASSYYTVPSCPDRETAEIPIGHPCDGEELIVLEDSRPAPVGKIGELYIRGVGLSPGYWRDPEKTRSVFVSDDQGNRMYKTGDLARLSEDGLVYLLGRVDSQIKSRGYRIELGEIETALYSLAAVRECAVVAIPADGFEGTAICCAYVPQTGHQDSPAELRGQAAELLPAYMLPSNWLAMDALPLNQNGKIDRPRLKQHFQTAAAAA